MMHVGRLVNAHVRANARSRIESAGSHTMSTVAKR
jgi:hypothetical protein